MKKYFMSFLFTCLLFVFYTKNSESAVFDGAVFKGEGENWSAELITTYNLWGEEFQSIKIEYIGENPEQLKENNVFVESQDFLGWGKDRIQLDEQGIYSSDVLAKVDSKTPTASEIILKIEGNKTETISLSSNS